MNIPLPLLFGFIVVAIALLYADFRKQRRKALENNPRYLALKAHQARVKTMGAAVKKASALFGSNDRAGAIAVMEEWRAAEPDVEPGDALLFGYGLLGTFYAAVNRMEDAAPLLEQALTFHEKPDNRMPSALSSAASIHDQLARYYTIKGDLEKKQTHYHRASEIWDAAGQRGYSARALASWYNNKGETLLAAEKYAEALANPPEPSDPTYRPPLMIQHMLMLWQAGRYSAALDAARDAVSENAAQATGAVGYRMLALAFGRMGFFAEAEGFVSDAENCDTSPGEAAQTLGTRCLLRSYQGKFAEVIAMCESYQADAEQTGESVSGQVLMHYANALLSVGRFDDAANAHHLAIAQYPVTDPMAAKTMIALSKTALATVELERGNHDSARALLDEAKPTAQYVPLLCYHLPVVSLHNDILSGRIAPNEGEERCVAERTRVREAMGAFPEPSDATRYFSEIVFHLARAFFAVGNSAECLRTLDLLGSGDSLSPGMLPTWHFWRGRTREAMGDTDAARREYDRVIETGEPENRYVTDARARLAALS